MLSLRWLGRVRPMGGIARADAVDRQGGPAAGQRQAASLEELASGQSLHGLVSRIGATAGARPPRLDGCRILGRESADHTATR